MTEAQIRTLVQQEIAAQTSAARFGLNNTAQHKHTGTDGPQISQNNILPGNRLEGRITFSQATTYRIATNFNPVAVWVQGNVTGALGEKYMVVGNAQLGGSSFYLQPGTSTSVLVGGTPQSIIQSTTYFGTDGGIPPVSHTVADEGHIVDVEYPLNTIHARATITGFDRNAIIFEVTTLQAGWEMNLSFTIT